ncbi:ALG6, ALG8 glycosyltransferase family-domain-containing protein [Irpex rosettiformis]|uniref:ALG6, ALG8 glycosyltransferase family-domain-containing protein n=1 Tax=Irpex rosettiformis TaxID=378272 RepID=A0ACB8U0N8_9APHY|nr:ALG6, ALG8 glycosyltransferase family-domain-containing protein [Irpex rosettiformis]
MADIARQSSAASSSSQSRRSSRITIPFPGQEHNTRYTEPGQRPGLSHTLRNSSSYEFRSNGSDTDQSDIVSPIPRRHLDLQRSESQHWLGSPPLSPISVNSRAISPLSFASTSPTRTRRKHTQSITSLLESDRERWKPPLPTIQQGVPSRGEKNDLHNSPARGWVRWMHRQGLKDWVIIIAIVLSVLVKWCIGLGSYSGQATPPMFGDYEAQRHWLELTVHLPIHQWYTYDLQYWGLDYPPLTAYISWICGIVGTWINPEWLALFKSRGYESEASKVFMRATVLAWDTLIYVPAVVYFTRTWQGNRSSRTQHVALLTLLLQPSLLIVDFGHFQYNSVMLGFTLLALGCFGAGHDALGAFCFVQSLGFKQMALYYAPAIGSYLLAKCIYLGSKEGAQLFTRLGVVTAASFILLFLPWLPPFAPFSAILDPISRIFPFSRGLFEDKVANFWCASNVVFKWRIWFSREILVKFSAALTAIGFAPSVFGLLYNGFKFSKAASNTEGKASPSPSPILPLLPYALLGSSMSFFLFSFQVHEKTVLVPLLPLTLLLSSSSNDSFTFQLGVLVNNVAMFSMWPLLKRDGLGLQYFVLLLLWNRMVGYSPFHASSAFLRFGALAVYAACIVLHTAEAILPPPARLPDLYPVLNVLVCTPVFAFTWLWSIKRGVEVSWALGGLGPASGSSLQDVTPAAKSKTSKQQTASFSRPRIQSDATPATTSLSSPVLDGNGSASGFSSALSDRQAARALKTRSLGYSSGRPSSLRTMSPAPEAH